MPKQIENNQKSNLKINFKSILVYALVAIGLYFLIPKIIAEKEVVSVVLKVKKPYLILALLCELISYIGAANLLGTILSRLGYSLPLKDRFRLSSIAAFAIHFFPVSGLGEGAVDFYFLRRKNVSPGSILLMFILRTIITYAAFLVLLVFALIIVPTFPSLAISPRVISLILFVIIAGSIIYLAIIYKNKQRFLNFILNVAKIVNKFLHLIHRKPVNHEQIIEAYDDIYKGMGLFANRKRDSVQAILGGLIYWLGDMSCLFFVFMSFGHPVSFPVLIFGYCIATLIGLMTLIPGGLGVTEGSMSLIFRALGLPLSISVASILVFRLFSFWIWIPIGLTSYITLKNATNKLHDS